jgi:hypothetical protein
MTDITENDLTYEELRADLWAEQELLKAIETFFDEW